MATSRRRGRGARRSSSRASAPGSRSACRESGTSPTSSSPAGTASSGTTSTRPRTRSSASWLSLPLLMSLAVSPFWRTQGACGLTKRSVDAGYFSSIAGGRIGRRTSSPPQLGQMPSNTSSAQSAQNVHSYVQILASRLSGGRSRSQHSQFGRSASIAPNLGSAVGGYGSAAAGSGRAAGARRRAAAPGPARAGGSTTTVRPHEHDRRLHDRAGVRAGRHPLRVEARLGARELGLHDGREHRRDDLVDVARGAVGARAAASASRRRRGPRA